MNTTIQSDAAKDGWVDGFPTGLFFESCFGDVNTFSKLRIGQGTESIRSYRSLVSFDVSSLKGAEIASATLFVYQSSVVGSPYTTGGNIVVDVVEYGTSLTALAWCALEQATDIGAISSNSTLGFKSLDVTSSLAFALSQGNSLLQFRFQSQEESFVSGYAVLEAGESQSSSQAPHLEVTYTPGRPNLTLFQPTGWSDKIVVSKTTGTNIDDQPLFPTDSFYVDWAATNDGLSPTTTQFLIELQLDGALIATWVNETSLEAGGFTVAEDFPLESLSRGSHTLKIVVDSTSAVTEENETDNEFTKTILVTNRSPVARAGPDRAVREGSPVSLNGGASSDPDEDTLSFAWTQTTGPQVTLLDVNSAVASLIAPGVDQLAVLGFRLTVSDGQLSASDTVNVTVTGNSQPVADAGPDRTVKSGSSVVINGSGSDPDGDTVTFSWSQLQGPQLALVGIDTPTLSFTAPEVTTSTTFAFRLTVSDGSLTSTDEVVVVVVPAGESTNLIFPQFVNGQNSSTGQVPAGVSASGNKTRIILRNNSDRIDTGKIHFRDASGNQIEVPINGIPTHNFLYSVGAWKTQEVETDGTGVLQSGVIEVVSDLGSQSKLEGTEVFEVLGNFVSVNNAPPETRQQTYVSVTTDENTGVALHNPHKTESITVDVVLVDGEEQARRQLTLGPLEQLVGFVDEEELFADFLQALNGEFNGTLNVYATGSGVSMLGLIQKRATGALIAVSATQNAFTPSN